VPGHTEDIIAKFSPQSKRKVYDAKYWWSDEWNPMDYGREYDFSKNFFEQFQEISEVVPLKNLDITNSVNCDYCASAVECKNCYMCSGGYKAEDSVYSTLIISSKNCGETLQSIGCEFLYDCVDCAKCFRVAHAQQCENCMYSQFLYDCRNCEYCFGCVNLRNKKYCIFNDQYTKEEYEKKIQEMDIGSRRSLEEYRKRWEDLKLTSPHRHAFLSKSIDCTGDIIESSKNCRHCFWISSGAENLKYAVEGGLGFKDSYDVYSTGGNSEMIYESVACGLGSKNVLFSSRIQQSHDVYYSFDCYGSSNLFGCISLRNKHHCILNRQYSKEEYEALVPKIIAHMKAMPYMDEKGKVYTFGEFFPSAIAPFTYDTSTANELVPKTRKELLEFGFPLSQGIKPEHVATIQPEELPDTIAETDDSILNEAIACADKGECDHRCTRVFKIVPEELRLLRDMNIPLPTLCSNCRNVLRLRKRNPLKLWHRKCMKPGCTNEFETSYSPERPEIVYCESCYQKEVV
jgi:hypothetical protein